MSSDNTLVQPLHGSARPRPHAGASLWPVGRHDGRSARNRASVTSSSMIEDAAQAIGTETIDGRRVGSIGDIGCFSFFPSKNLGAFGDAGLCTTNDPDLAERMRVLRVHGGKPKYFHALIGGNFRIDELQAAVLRVKLKYLDEWTSGAAAQCGVLRRGVRACLAALAPRLTTPYRLAHGRHIYNQYVVRARAPRRAARLPRANGRSAPRSTIRCRCICRNVSPISATRAGIFRTPSVPPRRRSRCRSIRSSSAEQLTRRGRRDRRVLPLIRTS